MMSPSNRSEDHDAQTTSRTVVCLFNDRSQAEQAIRDLKDAGFREDQIGVAMQDRSEQQALMDSTGSPAAEGAATGAVSGGLVGGLIGLLGSLLVPGLGPLVVGGVLASTLTGAGIGAAAGGLIGALVGMGVPEEDARHFDSGLRSGGALVTVNAEVRTVEAVDILQRHGGDLGPTGRQSYGRSELEVDVEETGINDRVTDLTGIAGGSGMSAAGFGAPGAPLGEVTAAGAASRDIGFEEDEPFRRGGGRRANDMPAEPWEGEDRRRYNDPGYAGPERRLVGV